jgi:TonB family protein
MHRFSITLLFLLSTSPAHSQDTISVDAVSAMPVCGQKNSPAGSPCATAPKPLSKINPSYPEKARQKGKEGTVIVALTVGKDGSVSGVHVVTGVDKEIDKAAIDAVRQWKFEPGTYQGNAVDVELTVSVNFRLSGTPQQAPAVENLQERKEAADDIRNLYSDAREAYSRGDYATAVNILRRVTSITPENGYAWNELGRALLAMNELDAAAQAFQSAIQKDPASRDAYNNLGLVFWRQRKYEESAAEFRRQIVVNPDDHYAHRNLGMMLRDQHRCKEAMPEIQKGLSLTPNHAESLIAEGECDIELGNQAKGISELQQATSISSAPNIFNSAAYVLANRNIELGMAEKWSDACLTIEKARLQNISIDHPTPEQLNYANWISAYWDTRGWIYFMRGDTSNARSYAEATWSLRTNPSVGYHLGRIYEKLGRPEDAAKIYAMAIASADLPTRSKIDQDDLDDAKKQLAKLVQEKADRAIKQARGDLSGKRIMFVANEGALSASADFTVRITPAGKPPEFYLLSGDKSLAKFVASLQTAKLPVFVPESADVQVLLRGTLTCHTEETRCRFSFLPPEEAVNLARNEMAMASSTPLSTTTHDPHVYEDAAIGIRISLPDEWKLVKLEQGSFSKPRNAIFGKRGSPAMFVLTKDRFEGSLDLYLKTLGAFLAGKTDFSRSGEETVKRDGLTGMRWNVSWSENGIIYSSVMEVFGVGDDYFRVTTVAPREIYERYAETFENMFHSVQFPMLHADPHLFEPAK